MFLSPPHADHSNELLDNALSMHKTSIGSYQNGLTDAIQSMSLGLGELSTPLETFNLWDNRSKLSTPTRGSTSKGIVLPETPLRPEDDHPPVFSPNTQLVNTSAVSSPLPVNNSLNVTTPQRPMMPTCATCGVNARQVSLLHRFFFDATKVQKKCMTLLLPNFFEYFHFTFHSHARIQFLNLLSH
ncbi:unnamed protein product [Strongylus vulgaris]|uniref:Uncharacterized protein n=1 Tax=Strongylus vulgaris TaxID=40348 RepID=A0A3P7IWV9_STRVU|nr:unnamed protein product [Strongylus vulgaris]